MEYRQLGRSGLQVSVIGLGANPLGLEVDEAGAVAVVNRALDLGVTFVDTANIYHAGRSEELVGKALKGRRHEVVLATKAGGAMGPGPNQRGASRQHLIDSLHASLKRLQTDHVDLFQIHQPDPNTPAEETMRALDDLVRWGEVRYIGSSNYTPWQICEAIWTARMHHEVSFISTQAQYNLVSREIEAELAPFCRSYGLSVIPYFPMASGFLSGSYRRGQLPPPGSRGAGRPTFARWTTDRNWDLLEKLEAFARARGHEVAELAIAWLLAQPVIATVIAGAEKPAEIEVNVRAHEWRLSADDLQGIDQITKD